jgi:hypothetical protein
MYKNIALNTQFNVTGNIQIGDNSSQSYSSSSSTKFAEWREMIPKLKQEELIEEMSQFVRLYKLKQEENMISLLSGRYSRLKKQEGLGLIENQAAGIERNQINASLLAMVSELEDFAEGKNLSIPSSPVVTVISNNAAIDINTMSFLLRKEYFGVEQERQEVLGLARSVIALMSQKFDERTFKESFTSLEFAIKDLEHRFSIDRLMDVLREISKHESLIIKLLKKNSKESTLEASYNDAKEALGGAFVVKFNLFLDKFFEVNDTVDKKLREKWQLDCDEFHEDVEGLDETDLFYKSQINALKERWLRKVKP